jgi:16S rRNA (cytosine967-C5)-methyltransferase
MSSLDSIFAEGRPADKVIQFQLKGNRKWGSQDRRLFAECVYDLVRWWRRLLFVCDVMWPAEDMWLGSKKNVNERVLEAWCILNEVELGKGIARSFPSGGGSVKKIWNDPTLPRVVRESLPDWLDSWASTQLGEQWDRVAHVLNSPAPVYLRANRLKTSPEELVRKLKTEQIEADTCGGDGVRLRKRANVFLTKAFHAGLFEVQDLNSQKVAPELQAEPGMRVVDACAGAGGKSLHLAALMKNKGKIIAMDVHEKKLEQLRLRSTRAGATSIETRLIENSKTWKRLEGAADRLLLDVPCSGMGVLRRNPDAKWRLTREEVQRLVEIQREILSGYSQMCKKGGILIYATCSVMPLENSVQVKSFLSQGETGFTLDMEETHWPEADGPDGFYLARLKRS